MSVLKPELQSLDIRKEGVGQHPLIEPWQAVCVPLDFGENSIGVMSLGHTKKHREFTEYHMRLAAIFGQHASMAILYSRTRQL